MVGVVKRIWVTMDGRAIPFRDLTDTHLANIINHIKCHRRHYEDYVLDIMCSEADRRGLGEDFLKEAPYPYDGHYDQEALEALMRKLIAGE